MKIPEGPDLEAAQISAQEWVDELDFCPRLWRQAEIVIYVRELAAVARAVGGLAGLRLGIFRRHAAFLHAGSETQLEPVIPSGDVL